jgi:hypothetical protein
MRKKTTKACRGGVTNINERTQTRRQIDTNTKSLFRIPGLGGVLNLGKTGEHGSFTPVFEPYQQAVVFILPVKGRYRFKWRIRFCVTFFYIKQRMIMQHDDTYLT